MPTAQKREKSLRRMMRIDIGLVFLCVGLVYLFGPDMWQSSGNLALLRALAIPIEVWASLFAIAGIALVIDCKSWNWLPYLVLTLIGGFWAFGQFATLITGTAQAGGGPFFVAGMAAHAFIGLFFTVRDRYNRNESGSFK